MHTIRLEQGEIVRLNDLNGFSIVVDGDCEVYIKSSASEVGSTGEPLEINGVSYQPLCEVRKGASMSSLFTTLSLFTGGVHLSDNRDSPISWQRGSQRSSQRNSRDSQRDSRESQRYSPSQSFVRESPVPHMSLDDQRTEHFESARSRRFVDGSANGSPRGLVADGLGLDGDENGLNNNDVDISGVNPNSINVNGLNMSSFNGINASSANFSRLQHPFEVNSTSGDRDLPDSFLVSDDIIAKAKTTSTIAIIPEEAFRRLTKKYPRATSNIVQVILTRCQRVTLQMCHRYLNLTPEIFETESLLNSKAKYELPSYLHDGAVRKLNEAIRESGTVTEASLKPPKRHKNSSKMARPNMSSISSRQVVLEPDESHPGDLLSSVPLSRRVVPGEGWAAAPAPSQLKLETLRFTGENETEDMTLRTALAECIFKILGFDANAIQQQLTSTVPSVEQSPFFGAQGANRGRSRSRLVSFSRTSLLSEVLERDRYSEGTGSVSSVFGDDDSVASGRLAPDYTRAQQEAAEMLEVKYFSQGSVLTKQGERTSGLFYVIDGTLEVGYTNSMGVYRTLHTVNPGGIGGFMGTVFGYKSFADIKAKSHAYVGFLSRGAIERLAERYPMLYISIAKTLTKSLSKLILQLDFALEWMQVPAGHVIFKENEAPDAIYIVLNGRVRSIVEEGGKSKLIGEFGQGGSIGELEVLTASNYRCTLHAIRESELARFPRTLFESLALRHPSMTFEISRLVASRVKREVECETADFSIPPSVTATYTTVAVIPSTGGLPVMDFAERLVNAFHEVDRETVLVNNASVLTYLGRNAFNKLGKFKLSGYLSELEERYQTVVYVADTSVKSPWTHRCIAQADCILLLADATAPPDVGEYEHLLVKGKTSARTELVLLHPDRFVVPGSTALWLKNRIWVHSHHHVQLQVHVSTVDSIPLGFGRLEKLKNKVQSIQAELRTRYRPGRRVYSYGHNYPHKNDFNRLARILSGQAVGLVLGGGGARGISHVGVLTALEENGIPIDFVGGTSIGAFIGGLYAKEYDLVPIYGRAKKFAGRIASLWRMALDLTYPATSYTTGHEFNRGIWKTFGDSRIEDFWISYYTNTTNITHSRMEIHTSGYSWRYIRASMSLAGLLPPLTDNGSMLLDGGYVDNLAVTEMRNTFGAKVIFAIDVGSIEDTTPMTYGDTLSGLWVLFNRYNIFSKHPNVPNLAEIQQRLAYVSSVGALEKAKSMPGVYYMRPPIDGYATLDFGKFDEIIKVGMRYGLETLAKWREEGKFPKIPGAGALKESTKRRVTRRNSI